MEKQRIALRLLVMGLLLVGLVSRSGALTLSQATGPGTLFGVAHSGPDGPSSLYTIDTSTGVATLVGEIGFARCGGMDFDSAGILYATCERMDGSNTIVLVSIDLATGAGTEVGPTELEICCLGASWTVHDLSIGSDDILFGHVGRIDSLVTFDLTTGKATLVGETGLQSLRNVGNGVAISVAGTLYNAGTNFGGFGSGVLYILNMNSGLATLLATTPFLAPADERPRINAMDFESGTDILFASLNDGSNNSPENYLAIIDIGTGAVTIIGRTVDGLDAIAFSEEELPSTSDLTTQKSNNINGIGEVGTPFNWTIEVANIGVLDAMFDSGEVLLQDMLPDSPNYGPPITGNFSGITGSNFISCSLEGHSLTCIASGGPVTIGGNGSFDVLFSVTPTMPGVLDNPAQGGICQVDPNNTQVEANENNNNCADLVTVEEEPTAIDLVSFEVEANGGQAIVTWETATEIDNAGFNIYQALSSNGPWMRVNSVLIAAKGDPVSGAYYTFTARPGRGTFYYRLEDIDFFGMSTLHGPALVEMGATIRVPWYRPRPPEFE